MRLYHWTKLRPCTACRCIVSNTLLSLLLRSNSSSSMKICTRYPAARTSRQRGITTISQSVKSFRPSCPKSRALHQTVNRVCLRNMVAWLRCHDHASLITTFEMKSRGMVFVPHVSRVNEV
ncbi:unnamed protein product [Periconia digitata]|uniref:Uncharacterized protein n=1 Tax=Periconia digitata TaxID=1303443 RepID=A0A9W4U7V7_9PLEO|nr:unnamed protein product [Periconia digitata]